jgi:hypothetical protein
MMQFSSNFIAMTTNLNLRTYIPALALLLCVLQISNPAFAQRKSKRDIMEARVIGRVMNIPEVRKEMKYVKETSEGRRHLSFSVNREPSGDFKYYWVRVWENTAYSTITHFQFYVSPKTMEVKYLDIPNDTLLDLNTWRKMNASKRV